MGTQDKPDENQGAEPFANASHPEAPKGRMPFGVFVVRHWKPAFVISFLFVATLVFVLRNDKVVAETTHGALLPFFSEAREESSDPENAFGVEQARAEHIAMLRLYADSLARDDLSGRLGLGKRSALRRDLLRISEELAKAPNARNGIAKAAADTEELYKKYGTWNLPIPTINPHQDGALLFATEEFCRRSEEFARTMSEPERSPVAKIRRCESTCLSSRKAFLTLVFRWPEYSGIERKHYVDHFLDCQRKSLELTRKLALEVANSGIDHAAKEKATLDAYAENMDRRIKIITAMNEENRAEVVRLFNTRLHPPKADTNE